MRSLQIFFFFVSRFLNVGSDSFLNIRTMETSFSFWLLKPCLKACPPVDGDQGRPSVKPGKYHVSLVTSLP